MSSRRLLGAYARNAWTTYVVTDIEVDGLNLGVNSMISFASVAVDEDLADHGHFTINLEPLEGGQADPDTMQWWRAQPEAWAEATSNPRATDKAVTTFADWVRSLPGRARPARGRSWPMSGRYDQVHDASPVDSVHPFGDP